MYKKETGVRFTPQEFRELNYCVCCGKEEKIEYGGRCSECSTIEYKHCEICDIVLRKGTYKFYSYDTKEDKRDSEVQFKANKRDVKEFVDTKNLDNIGSETLCKGCLNWEEKMSDVCPRCDNDFYNNKEHYKQSGNLCDYCVEKENNNLEQII